MNQLHYALESISIESLRGHIQALQGVRHRTKNPQALAKAQAYIQAGLETLGYDTLLHPFTYENQPFHNIIATKPGTRYPEERLIALAHYDSEIETPGADDNASGIAAVLELARVFQPLAFERTIHFIAVNLEERQSTGSMEESGLLGSRALAAHARESGWNMLGVVNFETIAYAGEDIPQQAPATLPITMPTRGNFIAIIGNQASEHLVRGYIQAIKRHNLALAILPLTVPGNGKMLPDTRRSDHARFWDEGYPAIMLTDTANFRSPHYHRPSDTLETLNLEFCRMVCQAGGGLIAEMAKLVKNDE